MKKWYYYWFNGVFDHPDDAYMFKQIWVYRSKLAEAKIFIFKKQLEETKEVLEKVEKEVQDAELAVQGNRNDLERSFWKEGR